MKRFHPAVSIVLGIFVTFILGNLLPNIPISNILIYFVLILGGFTATYLSKDNKAILGLYEGLIYSIVVILPTIFILKTVPLYIIFLIVLTPILGLLGGLIGKKLRS